MFAGAGCTFGTSGQVLALNTESTAVPSAADLNLNTIEDTPLTDSMLSRDADGEPVTYRVVDAPSHGALSGVDTATGEFTYTPDADYAGTDSFTYRATDGKHDSRLATVSITIAMSGDAPRASNGALTVNEDTTGSGTLVATDAEAEPLAFVLVTLPAHGTATITDPSTGAYSYSPAANYHGPDSFTFKASDGTLDSNVATVTLTVNSVNDPPLASNGTLTTPEDTTATGTLAATDVENDALTFVVVAQAAHGTVTVTNAATGAYSYVPAADYGGADSFTFKASDAGGDSNTATVTVTVTAVNDAPVALDITPTLGDGAPQTVTLSHTAVGGDAATACATSNVAGGAAGACSCVAGACTVSFTPTAEVTGAGVASFDFTVSNSQTSNTATATITVGAYCATVAQTNAPPFAGAAVSPASDGTAGRPYRICTMAQLQAAQGDAGLWSGAYVLKSDLDLSGYSGRLGISSASPFTGVFDGNGHEISNFTHAGADANVGLFGYVNGAAEIKNLVLSDATVAGSQQVGALVGFLAQGTVSQVAVHGAAVTTSHTGGAIVGTIGATAEIRDSYAEGGAVSGTAPLGGIAGAVASGGKITRVYSTVSVDPLGAGAGARGGLVGNDGGGVHADSLWDSTLNALLGDAGSGGTGGDLAGVTGETTANLQVQGTFTHWDFASVWQISGGQTPRLKFE